MKHQACRNRQCVGSCILSLCLSSLFLRFRSGGLCEQCTGLNGVSAITLLSASSSSRQSSQEDITYDLFICLCLKPESFWLAGLMMASEGDTYAFVGLPLRGKGC
jgi:hypothetical protein